jgi:amino acid permease
MAEDVTSSTPLLQNEYQRTLPHAESDRTTRYDYQSSSSMSTSPVPQPLGVDRKPADTDEQFASPEQNPHGIHESDFVTYNEQQDLRRGLHQRHISLIAIAGAIVRMHQVSVFVSHQ